MPFFAHTKGSDKSDWQLLSDHLKKTAELAAHMGDDSGLSEPAYIAGLLHDVGKYSLNFQRRLEGSAQKVDHATAGARVIRQLFTANPQKSYAELISYCIAGHHNGLPDNGSVTDVGGEGTLLSRLDPVKTPIPDYQSYKNDLDQIPSSFQPRPIKPAKGYENFSVSLLTRMLFSILVDADWLETETFVNGPRPRGNHDSIETLSERFNLFIRQFENPHKVINAKRNETLKACVENASKPQGIFTLTIPTGGGKTLASMGFALNHAAVHGLKRIIYVIPFTSIIEQNAGIFKDCLGENNVLEHHSNFDWEPWQTPEGNGGQDDETRSAFEKLKLAAENWDIPVVVTTNVQFFESLFAHKKSRCRKLHNLAKSVIIFDEAQMLPREFLQPCMLAVQELVRNYGVSAIFCTATQPVLKQFLPDIPAFTELALDPKALFEFYKRVNVTNLGTISDTHLLKKMNSQSQVLCIVNTRKHAAGLFEGLVEGGRFHLSTLMCPAHRKLVLNDIRGRLRDGLPCRVVSTQVMEAGIDVDFPAGYRALAGMDSILQAAGRVNREGRLRSAELFVFEPDSEFVKRTPTYIRQTGDVARAVLRDHASEPDGQEAIKAYFQTLIYLAAPSAFDARGILPHLTSPLGFEFKTVGEKFKLIENDTRPVIIPFDEQAEGLVNELRFAQYPAPILRKLQLYTVNIYENEFQAINLLGAFEMAADRYAVLKDSSSQYHPETGIILPAEVGGQAYFA